MAQVNWEYVVRHPLRAVLASGRILWLLGTLTARALFQKAPPLPTPSMRTLLGVGICGILTATDSSLLLDAPESCKKTTASVRLEGGEMYLIAKGRSVQKSDLVVLFCHGGGFAVGHPLQYRSMYRRWIRKASGAGLGLAIAAIRYRKSILIPSERLD